MPRLLGGSAAHPACQYSHATQLCISCSVEWRWHKLVCTHSLRGGGGGVQKLLSLAFIDPLCDCARQFVLGCACQPSSREYCTDFFRFLWPREMLVAVVVYSLLLVARWLGWLRVVVCVCLNWIVAGGCLSCRCRCLLELGGLLDY